MTSIYEGGGIVSVFVLFKSNHILSYTYESKLTDLQEHYNHIARHREVTAVYMHTSKQQK